MMEPQVVDLEDDSINFWASLGVSPHVDQMPLHSVQIVDHQAQSPLAAAAQPQSVCRDLFPVESDACLEPRLGMEFESGEAAKTFYIAYAGRVGFSVRIARSRKSKCSESIIMLRFVCSREGFSKEKRVECSISPSRVILWLTLTLVWNSSPLSPPRHSTTRMPAVWVLKLVYVNPASRKMSHLRC